MKNDEEKIIFLLKQGDSKAYKYIYDHHYVLLCSIACEFLKDTFLAKNIVDDLIFYLWENREKLNINISLRSYLVRSVRNRCINYLNLERERYELSFSTMSSSDQNKFERSESLGYPLATLLENELEEQIHQAINNLPEECGKIFRMSRFEEKSYEQIAREAGISVNTVKYHIKYALSRLTKELSRYLTFFIW